MRVEANESTVWRQTRVLYPRPVESFLALRPEQVLCAVERFGLRPTGHTTALTCLENRVHDVRLEDDRHVVVKFYRPGRWSREAILDEHRFLADLRAAEVPVCAPLVHGGSTLGETQGIFFAIWPRTGGRSPSELADEEIPVLGRLLARIHAVGATREAAARPTLTGAEYGLEPLAFLESAGFVPSSCARRYRNAVVRVVEIYDAWSEGVPLQRIHGDCHFGNLLRGPAEGAAGDAWFFLDFDDFLTGPAVQDVWMLLPGRDALAERQRAELVTAYAEIRAFDPRWLRLVEPLRALRFVRYAAWIARRWSDPAFPSAFPHFGTETYWETETRDLEELVRILDDGAGVLPPESGAARSGRGDGDRELTNEDFFWDL